MCGIIGFTFGDEELISNGLSQISHRGPDSKGLFITPEVSFGHCRLSIIDLSFEANQPMEDDMSVLVFNGEIYNYQDIKRDLGSKNYVFRTSSDTEVILSGYRRYGIEIFNKMRGMWGVAIYDKIKHKIILSRDPFGIKPLYYAIFNDKLYFSSELKGILKIIPDISPNTEAYYQYFNLGYFCAPQTCYKNIYKLMPGEILVWDMNSKMISDRSNILSKIKFTETNITLTESLELVDNALKETVSAHFISDVPVGLLLSGGNDSSLLAAISRSIGKNPKMYHLEIKGSLDTSYARRVAKHIGADLESFEMSLSVLEDHYSKIWDFLDEPTGDISIIPTSFIYSKIKGKSKVVISGEGADEFFGGYIRHRDLLKTDKINMYPLLLKVLDKISSGVSNFSLVFINPILNRIRNKLFQKGLLNDIIGNYLRSVKIIDFPYEVVKIRSQLFHEYYDSIQRTYTAKPLFFDMWQYLPNDLMYKNDISSMASSIESRVPFLDRHFFEKVIMGVPREYLFSSKYGSKFILKKIMERYLPKDLIYRKKGGFGFLPSEYCFEKMKIDLKKAIIFHLNNEKRFGIPSKCSGLFHPNKVDLIFKKYPRFAFALVTNYKIWLRYFD